MSPWIIRLVLLNEVVALALSLYHATQRYRAGKRRQEYYDRDQEHDNETYRDSYENRESYSNSYNNRPYKRQGGPRQRHPTTNFNRNKPQAYRR